LNIENKIIIYSIELDIIIATFEIINGIYFYNDLLLFAIY